MGQRSERELTVRMIVQDVHGREIPADVVRDVRDEAEQASRGHLPVREEVIEFLRKVREPLDAALLPAHPDMERTAKPRKSLEYGLTLDDDSGALFKIHFGGYEKDVWSRSRSASCSAPTAPRPAMHGGGASRP